MSKEEKQIKEITDNDLDTGRDLVTENYQLEILTLKDKVDLRRFSRAFLKVDKLLKNIFSNKLDKGEYGGSAQDLKNDIDTKVSKNGDTLNGILTSNSTSMMVSGVTGMHLHSNSDQIGFLNRDGSWVFRTDQMGTTHIGTTYINGGIHSNGNFTISNSAPIIELNETDTGIKTYLVADGMGGRLQRDSTAGANIFSWDRNTAWFQGLASGNVARAGDTMTGQLKINSYTPGQSGDRSIGFITTDYTGTQNEWLLGLQDYSSGKIAEVFGSTFADYSLRFAGRHRIYHEGFKPTANDIGALKRVEYFSTAVPKTFNGACQVGAESPDFAYVGGGSQMFMLQLTTTEANEEGAYVGQMSWGYDTDNPRIAIRCKSPGINGRWFNLLREDQVLGPQGQISGHVFMNQQYDGQAYLHAYPLNHEGTPVSFNLRTGRAGDMRAFEFGANGELTLPNRCLSYSTNLMYSHITGMQLHSNEGQIGFVNNQGHWGLRHTNDGISRTPHSLMFDSGDRVYGEYGSIGFLDSAGNWAFRVAPGSGEVTAKGIITSQGSEVLTFANVNRYCPHRVGDTIESTSAEHPASTWLGTQWERYGNGMVVVGVSEGEGEFASAGQTGGAKYVSLTAAQNGPHEHTLTSVTGGNGWYGQGGNLGGFGGITTSSSGSGEAHNNLQPYVALYRWRRVA